MRQTRAGSVSAGRVADHGLDALHRVYALHAAAAGVPADDVTMLPAALRTIVLAHRRVAAQRPRGESVVGTSTPGSDGGTSFDVITDEMPFVVESLLAGFGSHRSARQAGGAPRRHRPPRRIRHSRRGTRAGTGAARHVDRAVDRVDVDPVPVDEAQEIMAELRSVLHDVRDVAVDQDNLVEVARAVAAELVDAHPSDMDEGDVQDAARLIEWLVDGRFALLGHRLHDYRDEHPSRLGSRIAASRGGRRSRP